MRFERFPRFCGWLLAASVLLLTSAVLFAQETTGGLQGTVKDPSGAVVSKAHLVVTASTLTGAKSLDTDASGSYHFANLPPGIYSIVVTAKGFKTTKRDGLQIDIGRLPTVDIVLEVGTAGEVVEVTGQAPLIDVTTTTNQTNLTQEALADQPHGYSFQSVIQYAPMARNEPLAGGMGGTGGAPPGSTASGSANGYMIGGAADSESTYLVEGQDTENISMGFSNANVPFDFIQEVQVKTSGVEAEHGGALGGVINVVMKKGGNSFHGSLFGSYESDGLDANGAAAIRYDPNNLYNTGLDNNTQVYNAKQDHFRIAQPGFSIGGPIIKDRLWFFAGFAPEYNDTARTVNFNAAPCSTFESCPNTGLGNQYFTADSQQYFGTARLDGEVSQKIRVFGSWLYQYGRSIGALPGQDPIASEQSYLVNTAILNAPPIHGLGFVSPNSTYNFGADITLTPKIVSTTRFGYFFNNYHDFGYPTTGVDLNFPIGGAGGVDNAGNPLPSGLQAIQGGYSTVTSYDSNYTTFNASKHYQFDQDVAFFKSGWAGTHNIKVGYQYNRLSNVIDQDGNVPFAAVVAGGGIGYNPATAPGANNCYGVGGTAAAPLPGSLANEWGTCAGQYGYIEIEDFGTVLSKPAIDNNHALSAQDAWTVGHGLTLNLGIRVEKEQLPLPAGLTSAGLKQPTTINFGWGDKIEPRLGAAWGSSNGKIKVFGSYGVINDVMKLLIAQTSWGAQNYEICAYPLGPDAGGNFSTSDIDLTYVNGRACPLGAQANFAGGSVPPSLTDSGTGITQIENYNLRPWEPIAPGVKPYRQHEYVAGVDYQINRDWGLEARYDRRRLDHAIEDASLSDPNWGELYTIVNPGQGVNKTINGYSSFLQSEGFAYGNPLESFSAPGAPQFGTCTGCPDNPTAVRNYDGLELRLTKITSKGFAGMFSYTWSSLWGNYTGLTTTDQIDGGTTGRASPDTTRSFDEPFYYFTAAGKSGNGPLPTDRPNAFKGNIYYNLPWKGMTSTLGLFQVAYQGSPVTTSAEIGGPSPYDSPFEDTYIYGRGQWSNITQDPTTGDVTFGNPYTRRTPWFTQTDFNFVHSFKVNKNNERQVFSFQATIINLLNQHAPISYWQTTNSYWSANDSGIVPSGQGLYNGAAFYQAAETGYSIQNGLVGPASVGSGFVLASDYGTANQWQQTRKIRLGVKFAF